MPSGVGSGSVFFSLEIPSHSEGILSPKTKIIKIIKIIYLRKYMIYIYVNLVTYF